MNDLARRLQRIEQWRRARMHVGIIEADSEEEAQKLIAVAFAAGRIVQPWGVIVVPHDDKSPEIWEARQRERSERGDACV